MAAIRLFEVLYQAEQTLSQDLYTPLEIENNNPEWRELQAYLQLEQQHAWQQNERVGVFSPKFEQKTQISLQQFTAFATEQADSDICLINPFPQIAYYSFNVWMQGEVAHPGLTASAQALLSEVGLSWDGLLAYANYWVASEAFWGDYVGKVLKPIAAFIQGQPSHPVVKQVLAPTPHTDQACLLPFIIERLLSTYLSFNPKWRVAAYPIYHEEILEHYCLNAFERLLYTQMRQEVVAADANPAQAFDPVLKQKMQMATELRQQHFFDFYQSRPHPHTGRPIQV